MCYGQTNGPNQTKCINELYSECGVWINPTTESCTLWMSHLGQIYWLTELLTDELLELLEWLFATKNLRYQDIQSLPSSSISPIIPWAFRASLFSITNWTFDILELNAEQPANELSRWSDPKQHNLSYNRNIRREIISDPVYSDWKLQLNH